MDAEAQTEISSESSRWSAAEVEQVLLERGWLRAEEAHPRDTGIRAWLGRAAELLGPHAKDRSQLAALLELIFSYDAFAILQQPDAQTLLVREGAREVIRELANQILAGGEIDSDRFKQIIDAIKEALPYRSRAMFQPIRLALAGRAGEGELDRVILLVDSVSKLGFEVQVKSVRQRMLEFCVALG